MKYLTIESIDNIEKIESLLFTKGMKKESELLNQHLSSAMRFDDERTYKDLLDSLRLIVLLLKIKHLNKYELI